MEESLESFGVQCVEVSRVVSNENVPDSDAETVEQHELEIGVCRLSFSHEVTQLR